MLCLSYMVPTSGALANAIIRIPGCLWSWTSRATDRHHPKLVKYSKKSESSILFTDSEETGKNCATIY